MKKVLLMAMAAVLLLGGTSPSPAQQQGSQQQPIATVAFRGYDELKSDIEFIGQAGGNPQLAAMVDGAVAQQLGPQAMATLDKARPWGLVVQTDGQNFSGFAFLPVTDLGKLLGALEPRLGKASRDGGLYRFDRNQQSIFLKQQGQWTLISNSADSIAAAPADPVALLAGLEKQYDIAARIVIKNIPAGVRQMLMLPIQMGMQMGMQRLPDESDEQYQLRMKMSQQAITQMNTALEELDTFQLALDIDRTARKASIEYIATAKEGTKIAQQMATSVQDLTTQFAGLVQPQAALTFNVVSQLPDESIEQMKTQFSAARARAEKDLDDNDALSGEQQQQAEKLLGMLFDAIQVTIEEGRIDAAGTVSMEGDAPTLVAGAHVVDPQKLEEVLKQVAELASQEEPSLAQAINLEAGEHAGVTLHELNLPVAAMGDAAADFQKIFGDTLDVVVGIGEKSVYLAAGADASQALQQAIDASDRQKGAKVPPARFRAAVGQVAGFVSKIAEDDAQQVAETIRRTLAQKPGKDHITMSSSVIPNGQKVRVEVEEGILALLGALPTLMMSMQAR